MYGVVKKQGKLLVNAYKLGDKHPVINALIAKGKIVCCDDGTYRVFSSEISGGQGEKAYKGDYVKVDSAGNPYPNSAEFFEKNHRSVGKDAYEQIPRVMPAWDVWEAYCEEIDYLVRNRGLVMDESSEICFYKVSLWGTVETAAKDAVIVFYDIRKNDSGQIADADFNFVMRSEFEKTYDYAG